jgi:hypothetical protein
MNNFYKNIIDELNSRQINFIVIGGQALNLLNIKYHLNINIDLDYKDLDLVIDDYTSASTYILNNYNNYLEKNTKVINKIVLYNENYRIDFIKDISRNIKINNNVIQKINYFNLINYSYFDSVYNINVVDLKIYYGLIKATGLTKYKTIKEVILQKYPNIKEEVIA